MNSGNPPPKKKTNEKCNYNSKNCNMSTDKNGC